MTDEDTIVVAQPQQRKRSYHIWTHEQRVCVYLLSHEFRHLNITARAKVFNKIFETKLAVSSIPFPGLKPIAIYQAYWKSKAPGMDVRQPWKDVYFPPDTVKERTMRGSMRARIAFILSSSGTEGVWCESAEIGTSGTLTVQSTLSEQNITGMQSTEKRKRPATILMTPPSTAGEGDEDEDEDEFDLYFSPRKTNRRQRSPVVMVPSFSEAPDLRDLVDPDDALPRSSISPQSPGVSRAIPGLNQLIIPRSQLSMPRINAGPNFVSEARSEMLPRRNMVPIPITPEKLRAAQAPFRDIPDEEAHPPLPRILFRAFTTESQGLNSANGFVCGRYANARVAPSGPPRSLDWDDVLEHLDPSKTPLKCKKCMKAGKCCGKLLHQKMLSSYISFSSDLVWVIRKMMSQGEQSYISVVDTSTLDPLSVFYVPPYQQELARKHLFHGREHRYKGYSEHLVYHEVLGSAIVRTFSYQELIGFAQSDRLTRETLRLPELRCSGTSSTEILKIMKQNKLKITPQVAILIANFVMFLGIGSNANMEDIAFLVCEIVRGWALQNAQTSPTERRENADSFMDTFYRKSDRVLSIEEQGKLRYA
jgi:hypothetical protein